MVVDNVGNLVVVILIGGLVNKMIGRIGDFLIIGVGTYVNIYCVVFVTGDGEDIIRGIIVRDVVAFMEYKDFFLKEVVFYVVEKCVIRGSFGLIVVLVIGEVIMFFNIIGMF